MKWLYVQIHIFYLGISVSVCSMMTYSYCENVLCTENIVYGNYLIFYIFSIKKSITYSPQNRIYGEYLKIKLSKIQLETKKNQYTLFTNGLCLSIIYS